MRTLKSSQARAAAQAGFSIAELMVVILIIGLLSTVVVPKVIDRLSDAKIGKVKADLPAIAGALDQYMIANGRYPDGLESLVQGDDNGRTFLNQRTVPKDPWGNEYVYQPPGGGSNEFELFTFGRDGVAGGEGEDRDVTYAMIRDQEI
ncbi:MAG: type II secretion system major pseudopilin GspG [Planctomycetes bacterium]|jgi:general secretion pathway protein G|nr:type II secretion system major pseudopilin GspG [Planctomycetota bacterium]